MKRAYYFSLFIISFVILSGCTKVGERSIEAENYGAERGLMLPEKGLQVVEYIPEDETEEEYNFTLADSYKNAFSELTNDQIKIEEPTYSFINTHVEYFPAIYDEAMAWVKSQSTSNYSYPTLTSSFKTYATQFLSISGSVIQVEQDFDSSSSFTHIHLRDLQGHLVVGHLLFNVTEKPIEVGDTITMFGVAVGQLDSTLASGETMTLPLIALTHIEN